MSASSIGIAIACLAGFWLFGGVLLRFAGALGLLLGGIALAAGRRDAILVLAVGAALLVAGRLHRVVRQSA